MEESTAPNPQPNEFVIPDTHAYAFTNIEISNVAEFLMTKLEPVGLEQLDLDDQVCVICKQEFRVSDDVRLSHTPVKTVCGHIFGRGCIIKWLDPLCFWGLRENGGDEVDLDEGGKSGCPICRHSFFPQSPIEPMIELAYRLSFWDMAYASAGVARSEKEEHSRRYLWDYVNYCRSIDENEQDFEKASSLFDQNAQKLLLDFARTLKMDQNLTAEQEHLRQKLERIGRKDLEKCRLVDEEYYEFEIDRDDNERSEFAQPLETDVEAGMGS